MKRCLKCQSEKPLKDFYTNRHKPEWFSSRCKACIADDNKAKYQPIPKGSAPSKEVPQSIIQEFRSQIPEDIFQRTKIQVLNSGVLNINITKSAHQCWNLFVLPTELQAAVEFVTNGKLDARRWTSTTPTLHNHWTIRAFDRLLGYASRLPDFKHDVSE
jgi:hypothetical protein